MRILDRLFNFHDLTAGKSPKNVMLKYTDFAELDKRVIGGNSVLVPKLKDIQVARFESLTKYLITA